MRTEILTNAQKVKHENKTAKQQILELLKATEYQYNQYQYDKGIEFLEFECEGVYDDVTAIASTQIFWGWWRNQWAARDSCFLNLVDVMKPELIASNYRLHNSPTSILFQTEILQKSYAQLMSKIIKKELA